MEVVVVEAHVAEEDTMSTNMTVLMEMLIVFVFWLLIESKNLRLRLNFV